MEGVEVLGYCGVCYQEKQTHCLCPNRCPDDCNYTEPSPNYTLIKDCLSIDWSVPPGQVQTVFRSLGNSYLYASGFITFDSGTADNITVRFFLNGIQVGAPLNVFNDSSVAFSLTKFDEITVECNGLPGNDTCEGEVSLLIRTPMFINS